MFLISNIIMSIYEKKKLQLEALQWAKYLDNYFRRGFYNDDSEIPLPSIEGIPCIEDRKHNIKGNDYISEYFMIEDGISAKDIIFGPLHYKNRHNQIDHEYILIDRGADDYFGYTLSHPAEVIAIGKTCKFTYLNIPYGLYQPYYEISFYEIYFCGVDLNIFKDDLDAFDTIEEHISQIFLDDTYEGKFKSFTLFSTPEDLFTIEQVLPESVY